MIRQALLIVVCMAGQACAQNDWDTPFGTQQSDVEYQAVFELPGFGHSKQSSTDGTIVSGDKALQTHDHYGKSTLSTDSVWSGSLPSSYVTSTYHNGTLGVGGQNNKKGYAYQKSQGSHDLSLTADETGTCDGDVTLKANAGVAVLDDGFQLKAEVFVDSTSVAEITATWNKTQGKWWVISDHYYQVYNARWETEQTLISGISESWYYPIADGDELEAYTSINVTGAKGLTRQGDGPGVDSSNSFSSAVSVNKDIQ